MLNVPEFIKMELVLNTELLQVDFMVFNDRPANKESSADFIKC
jgi:hypothetical protein